MRSARDLQEPLTLGLGASLLRSAHLWGLLLAAVGVPLLVLVGVVITVELTAEDGADIGATLQAAWTDFLQEPGNRLMLWSLAALTPLALVFSLAQRLASIRITPMGLQAHIPPWLGLGLFKQSAGRWDVLWDDIRRVRLVPPRPMRNPVQRLGWFRLVLETSRGEIRLNPFPWFERGGTDHRLGLPELLRPRRVDPAQRLRSAPLMRVLEARGFELEGATPAAAAGPAGFDLAGHNGMRVQLGLLSIAGLYALADTFFIGNFHPLGPLPVAPFIVTAVVALAAVVGLGVSAPRTERLAVGALTVMALVAAVYPATLRINAASAEAAVVTYVAVGSGRFEPRDERLPPIDLSGEDLGEYWVQYPPGSEHEFTLLQGIAGFHQLDLAPLYERTRRFYREHRRGS